MRKLCWMMDHVVECLILVVVVLKLVLVNYIGAMVVAVTIVDVIWNIDVVWNDVIFLNLMV